MAIICPTVTAVDQAQYAEQLGEISSFAHRIHIDVSDGVFAPVKLLPPQNIYWPSELDADIHVMYTHPLEIIETLIGLKPKLIVIHAESPDAPEVISLLKGTGINIGLSLLQNTSVESASPLIKLVDHILIFSGDLGHFGGKADLSLLDKVTEVKKVRDDIEFGWDGGISLENAAALTAGGIVVLNVGGAIHKAADPKSAFRQLTEAGLVHEAT